jgi:hypothetical protein
MPKPLLPPAEQLIPDELREMPLWLSRSDMANLHGVSERTISRWVKLKKANIPDADPRHLPRLRWYKPHYITFIYGQVSSQSKSVYERGNHLPEPRA